VTTPILDPDDVRRVVGDALAEDLGDAGDVTAEAVVPEGARARARLVAREGLVVAGVPVAFAVFRRLDPRVAAVASASEGARAAAGDTLLAVEGQARALLSGERTALNLLQRMCGIATAARAAVDEVAGTGAIVLDTRKTAPGLRRLDKYAVACGGATNHRMGLHDAVMIKDTHAAVAGPIGAAVLRALAHGHPRERVTAEVATVEQLEEAISAGAGRVLLDNMDLETLAQCVRHAHGRVVLEASGGLRPGGLRAVAETGVDCLSVGYLTHSVRAADVAMDLERLR
jgi:nicotinate-nucleotide pyrophosphorylase (carboxylating)